MAITVGIADDSKAFRSHLKRRIKSLKAVEILGEAASIEETRQLLQATPLDVLILDYRFPERNGTELLAELTKWREKPLVIVCTNFAQPEYRKICLAAGADYFFDKTFQFQEMLDLLSCLSSKRADRELRAGPNT